MRGEVWGEGGTCAASFSHTNAQLQLISVLLIKHSPSSQLGGAVIAAGQLLHRNLSNIGELGHWPLGLAAARNSSLTGGHWQPVSHFAVPSSIFKSVGHVRVPVVQYFTIGFRSPVVAVWMELISLFLGETCSARVITTFIRGKREE